MADLKDDLAALRIEREPISKVRGAFTVGVDVASAERLIMTHKVSLIQLLPISYEQQIRSTPGVKGATHSTWFGGTYQDVANQFAVMAVDPSPFMEMYPEFHLTDAEKNEIGRAHV